VSSLRTKSTKFDLQSTRRPQSDNLRILISSRINQPPTLSLPFFLRPFAPTTLAPFYPALLSRVTRVSCRAAHTQSVIELIYGRPAFTDRCLAYIMISGQFVGRRRDFGRCTSKSIRLVRLTAWSMELNSKGTRQLATPLISTSEDCLGRGTWM